MKRNKIFARVSARCHTKSQKIAVTMTKNNLTNYRTSAAVSTNAAQAWGNAFLGSSIPTFGFECSHKPS